MKSELMEQGVDDCKDDMKKNVSSFTTLKNITVFLENCGYISLMFSGEFWMCNSS